MKPPTVVTHLAPHVHSGWMLGHGGSSPSRLGRQLRTCAWEDTCKRLRLRFAPIQPRHDGRKLLAYTLIKVRRFCGA